MKKSYTKIPGQPLNKEIFNIRLHPSKLSQKPVSVRGMAQEVPEEAGTIEAEKGETIVGNMNNDGMPVFQKIGGKSHAQGGTILNAPDNAYVYSKFNKMKIKNPYILESFGLDPYTAKTPAQISTKYDFSDSTRGLYDPMSDKLQLKTYEMNIRNSVNKLGKLALAQEGIKGFPNGIPKISEPYLMNTGMSPELFIGNEPGDFNQQGMPMAKSGGQLTRVGKKKVKIVKSPNKSYMHGGGFEKYQTKGNVSDTIGLAKLDSIAKSKGPVKYSTEEEYQAGLLNKNKSAEQLAAEREWALNKAKAKKTATPPQKSTQELSNLDKAYLKGVNVNYVGFSPVLVRTGDADSFKYKYPDDYKYFQEAFFSNDPKKLKDASKYFEDRNVEMRFTEPSTWLSAAGIVPGSEQDIFQNFGGILKERKQMIEQKQKDEEIGNKVNTAINVLKAKKEQEPSVAERAKIQQDIENLYYRSPEYKKTGWSWWKYEDKRIPGLSYLLDRLGMYDPDMMYNKSETQDINNILKTLKDRKYGDKYNFPEQAQWYSEDKEAENTPNVQVSDSSAVSLGGLTPADSIAMLQNVQQQAPAVDRSGLIESSYTKEEAELLGLPWPPKKMYGGSQYKLGGSTSNYFAKFQAEDSQVQSGKLTPEQQKKLEEHRASKARGTLDYERYKKAGKATIPYSPQEAFGKKGITLLNAYRKQFGLPEISESSSKTDIQAAAGELQKHMISNHPELVADYMKARNPKPNNKLISTLSKKGYPGTNEGLKQALTEGKLTDSDLRDAYNDNQWWFRALHTKRQKLSKDEYEQKMKDPSAIKSGGKLFFPSEESPEEYTEYYTSEEPKTEAEIEEEPSAIEKGELKGTTEPSGPIGKWWWQDRVQSFADLMDRASIKKYYPQNFAPDVYLPQPTYYDPNRELAQQASVASTAARAARTIFDPSQASEILNNIQATAANQAANTIGRYANLNVGVANQFALTKSNLLNAYSRALAQGKTQEANQLAILNQQYDNSLRQMRARQTANYKQAITNMAKTDVLNSLYPQYAVDPETGGTRPVFLRGKVPTATNPYTSADSVKEIKEIMDKLGITDTSEAIKVWERSKGYDTSKNTAMTNPHQYPSSYPTYGYDGYSQTGEEEDTEDNQSTAYDYGYWDNMYNQPNYGDMEDEG